MNFNAIFLKSFRVLLLPFALLYGLIIIIRNFLYDKRILRSVEFNFPVICVGNLAAGGTGKSPMVEYLAGLLHPLFNIATLSRGYKRKTKGYVLANEKTTALDIGDEPMQFHLKFPGIAVAAGEERIVAIPQLLHDRPELEAIILDDAFQHRTIKSGLNILLTEYNNLFTRDFFLPTGDLRDERLSYKRAEVIVVTKCPENLKEEARKNIVEEINPLKGQQVFFTTMVYGIPYHIIHHSMTRQVKQRDEVLLVCGIANPRLLKKYLSEHAYTYYQQDYSDHHIFSIDDLKDINKKFESIEAKQKIILTTEKDAVRLIKFKEELEDMRLYVLPVAHLFLFDEAEAFNKIVIDFIKYFKNKHGDEC